MRIIKLIFVGMFFAGLFGSGLAGEDLNLVTNSGFEEVREMLLEKMKRYTEKGFNLSDGSTVILPKNWSLNTRQQMI
ncbi:hypothetical protein ES708_30790 [subsurface metagenome]